MGPTVGCGDASGTPVGATVGGDCGVSVGRLVSIICSVGMGVKVAMGVIVGIGVAVGNGVTVGKGVVVGASLIGSWPSIAANRTNKTTANNAIISFYTNARTTARCSGRFFLLLSLDNNYMLADSGLFRWE